jgi:hypothetical protein
MCILREQYNKIIVTRWFDEYWGENYNEALLPNSPLPPYAWCPRCIERVRATST